MMTDFFVKDSRFHHGKSKGCDIYGAPTKPLFCTMTYEMNAYTMFRIMLNDPFCTVIS